MSFDRQHLLFYDEELVHENIERLGGDFEAVSYDRKKSVELSITGPKAKLEESNRQRPKTRYEQLAHLIVLLGKAKELAVSRPTERHQRTVVVRETCDAVRVVVPDRGNENSGASPLVLWIALGTEAQGVLCLMEGRGKDKSGPTNYALLGASTYTVLQSLVHFAREQKRGGVINDHVPDDPHPNPHAKIDESHPPSLVQQYHNVRSYCYNFATDPLDLLRKWGCHLSPAKRIDVLYQVRESGPDSAHSWSKVTVFAYPIAIAEP